MTPEKPKAPTATGTGTGTGTEDEAMMALACSMTPVPDYIVPATVGSCEGHDFKLYWTRTPDVVIRIYQKLDAPEADYVVYDPNKHSDRAFGGYHEMTPAGSDVEHIRGGPWVGIILS